MAAKTRKEAREEAISVSELTRLFTGQKAKNLLAIRTWPRPRTVVLTASCHLSEGVRAINLYDVGIVLLPKGECTAFRAHRVGAAACLTSHEFTSPG